MEELEGAMRGEGEQDDDDEEFEDDEAFELAPGGGSSLLDEGSGGGGIDNDIWARMRDSESPHSLGYAGGMMASFTPDS